MDPVLIAGLASSLFSALLGISLGVLAPRDILFGFVEEGRGKIVVRMGGRHKPLLQWAGYVFTKDLSEEDFNIVKATLEKEGIEITAPDWDIVLHPDPKKRKRQWWQRIFGGFRYIGIPGIDGPFVSNFRWPGIKLTAQGIIEPVFYEEKLNYFLAQPDLYILKAIGLETKPPERLVVDVIFQWPMRIINPRKAFWEAPPNIFENTIGRILGWLRPWVGSTTFDELLKLEGQSLSLDKIDKFVADGGAKGGEVEDAKGGEVEGAKGSKVKNELFKWGILITGPIQISSVNLTEELKAAQQAEQREEWLAKAASHPVMTFYLQCLAAAQGRSIEEVKEEFRSEEGQKKLRLFLEEMTRIQLALKRDAYLEINTRGGSNDPLSGSIREYIATAVGLLREEKKK